MGRTLAQLTIANEDEAVGLALRAKRRAGPRVTEEARNLPHPLGAQLGGHAFLTRWALDRALRRGESWVVPGRARGPPVAAQRLFSRRVSRGRMASRLAFEGAGLERSDLSRMHASGWRARRMARRG